jgi:phosphatidylglycerol---prolipoprotein diacylglyceryl transferase
MITFPNINPVILKIGPLAISWYSLSYVVGILLAWSYGLKLVKKFDLKISHKNLEDFVTWAVISIVIGGRLGYISLYNPWKYLAHPVEILKTYEGGMSFHGGITGLILAAYFFCRKYHINFLNFTDILAATAPIGLFLGRVANFINSELYGRVTDAPWAIIFPGSEGLPRHPSQLYEAFCEGFLLLLILAYGIFKKNSLSKAGLTSGIFLILYASFRILIEFFREPDIHIGFIFNAVTMGQILSLPMLMFGVYLCHSRACCHPRSQ